jgi:predicted CXXCH cytochrome family protein
MVCSLLGLVFIVAAALLASPATAAEEFKLRPGARGKLCVGCHDGFAETLKKPFVHTPIAEGDCSGCHNPHTSNHEMLLSATTGEMCQDCHDDLVPPTTESAHQVFVEGKCMSCHDSRDEPGPGGG